MRFKIKFLFLFVFFGFNFETFSLQNYNFPTDCKSIHEGFFYFIPKGYNFKVIVDQTNKDVSIQHRLYKKNFMVYTIFWHKSCLYTLTIKNVNDDIITAGINTQYTY